MLQRTVALALLVGATLFSGCDGHLRRLSVHDPSAPQAPWLLTVIENQSGKDVAAVVAVVSKDLGLQPSKYSASSYDTLLPNGYTFSISVDRDERRHIWIISLLDWPTFKRSGISIDAEARLLAKLKEPS